MTRLLWLAWMVSCLAGGCSAVRVAGECPETAGIRCLTQKVCLEDKRRACLVCTCESGWESDPARADQRMRGRLPE